jgi:hypothetical protein
MKLLLALALSAGVHAGETAPESARKAKVLQPDTRGCTWIEAEGLVSVGHDETRSQVRGSAINEARQVAMQDFLGVNVRSRTLDFQQEGLKNQTQVVEQMLLTTRQGRIIDEKIVAEGYRDLTDCPGCRYSATIRACILPTPAYADKEFSVDLGLSRTRLVQGDEVTLNVTATRDCYLYVYDLWQDMDKASLVLPNEVVKEVKLKAGETWEYPNADHRKQGVMKLEAQLPDGIKVSAETVRVIASKTPLPQKLIDPAQGFIAILRKLNAGKIDWAEDAKAFTIFLK